MAESLVKALKSYFEMDGAQMIKEFKQLTEDDKQDFVDMFAEIGVEVERPEVKKAA